MPDGAVFIGRVGALAVALGSRRHGRLRSGIGRNRRSGLVPGFFEPLGFGLSDTSASPRRETKNAVTATENGCADLLTVRTQAAPRTFRARRGPQTGRPCHHRARSGADGGPGPGSRGYPVLGSPGGARPERGGACRPRGGPPGGGTRREDRVDLGGGQSDNQCDGGPGQPAGHPRSAARREAGAADRQLAAGQTDEAGAAVRLHPGQRNGSSPGSAAPIRRTSADSTPRSMPTRWRRRSSSSC